MFSRDQDLECEVTGTVIDGEWSTSRSVAFSLEKRLKWGAEGFYSVWLVSHGTITRIDAITSFGLPFHVQVVCHPR